MNKRCPHCRKPVAPGPGTTEIRGEGTRVRKGWQAASDRVVRCTVTVLWHSACVEEYERCAAEYQERVDRDFAEQMAALKREHGIPETL